MTRAIKVLQLLAEAGRSITLSDIARRLGLAKSSTAHLCAALEDGGLILKNELGYALGWGIVDLAGAYLRDYDPVREFYRLTSDRSPLSDHPTQLGVLDDTDVLFIARNSASHVFGHPLHVGDKFAAAHSAVGRALLAQLPAAEIDRRFGNRTLPASHRADLDDLHHELSHVRQQGCAVEEGEVFRNVVWLAVPVPADAGQRPAMAVGVATALEAATSEHRARLRSALQALAARLTASAGWVR